MPTAEGVRLAWQWLTLLCCTAAQTRLPFAALQLLNDLVQLLWFHTEQASQPHSTAPGHADATKTQVSCLELQ